MINFLKNWCEGIIVAVIISMIIESILPDGNNKKYIKVIIGIYIIFTILNPLLEKIDTNFEFDNDKFASTTIETSTVNTENIRQLYANGIEETLKTNIQEEFGYNVNSINITYDKNYENIENINLSIFSSNINQIQKVEIGNETKSTDNKNDYSDVKKYISENYEVDKSKIIIN